MVTDEQEKADILADTLSQNSSFATLTDAQKQQRTQTKFPEPVHDNTTYFKKTITREEVAAAIRDPKIRNKDKRTGSDKVSYIMLSHLPPNILDIIANIFNKYLTTGTTHPTWKQATVITIHKHGKPIHDPQSYRPISLISHIAKIYERILNERLIHYPETNEILPPEQAGFRKVRSTTEHIMTVVEQIKHARLRKNLRKLAVFFDISKAFDRVWHEKLLHKMAQLKVTGHLYLFVKEFLSNRTMRVRSGDKLSTARPLDMGVPQGSVIAPTLFILFLHDLVKEVGPQNIKSNLKMFADDLALVSRTFASQGVHIHVPQFQDAVNKIVRYLADNSLELSEHKTQLLLVSGRNRTPNRGGLPDKNKRHCRETLKLSQVFGSDHRQHAFLDWAYRRPGKESQKAPKHNKKPSCYLLVKGYSSPHPRREISCPIPITVWTRGLLHSQTFCLGKARRGR